MTPGGVKIGTLYVAAPDSATAKLPPIVPKFLAVALPAFAASTFSALAVGCTAMVDVLELDAPLASVTVAVNE